MKLDGKVAIVTGAGTGMGQTIALTLAEEGANIVIADIDIQSAENVAGKIESMGRQALAIKTDVTDREEVNKMVEKTLDAFKKIDILVNNAGIVKVVPSVEITETDFDSVIDVNLKGGFLCSQAVGKQMIKQKQGKIVNIASTAAHRGFLGLAAYCASKGGALLLTRQLAVEWALIPVCILSGKWYTN